MFWFLHEVVRGIRMRNADSAEQVDISDLLHLIDYIFTGGYPLAAGHWLCAKAVRLKRPVHA